MKKAQQHTPEAIKKYTAAMCRFRMPAKPLLTLDGIKKPAPDTELEMGTVVPKTEEKL